MKIDKCLDTLIVGAGFAGMYILHKQMSEGFKVEIFEQADDVGGTWYWNKYPGARCDIESMDYSYSFSEDLQQEWNWKEKYGTQPELLEYAKFVCKKFGLRKNINFNTFLIDSRESFLKQNNLSHINYLLSTKPWEIINTPLEAGPTSSGRTS